MLSSLRFAPAPTPPPLTPPPTSPACPFMQLTLASFPSFLPRTTYSSWTLSALMLHNGLSILTHDPASATAGERPRTPPKSLSSQCDNTGIKWHWWLVVQTWTFLPNPTPSGAGKIDSPSSQSSGECNSQTAVGLSAVNRLPALRIIMRSTACLWILKLALEPISSPWNRLTTKNGARLILVSNAEAAQALMKSKEGRCTPCRKGHFLI